MIFLGPVRSDIFKYHFGHFTEVRNKNIVSLIFWWTFGLATLFIIWLFTSLVLFLRRLVKQFL